jgi:hypothetical protein
MSKWISVNERLPDMELDNLNDPVDDVLIVFQRTTTKCNHCGHLDGDYFYGIGYVIHEEWKLTELLENNCLPLDYEDQIKVTHWMPLPELPK